MLSYERAVGSFIFTSKTFKAHLHSTRLLSFVPRASFLHSFLTLLCELAFVQPEATKLARLVGVRSSSFILYNSLVFRSTQLCSVQLIRLIGVRSSSFVLRSLFNCVNLFFIGSVFLCSLCKSLGSSIYLPLLGPHCKSSGSPSSLPSSKRRYA